MYIFTFRRVLYCAGIFAYHYAPQYSSNVCIPICVYMYQLWGELGRRWGYVSPLYQKWNFWLRGDLRRPRYSIMGPFSLEAIKLNSAPPFPLVRPSAGRIQFWRQPLRGGLPRWHFANLGDLSTANANPKRGYLLNLTIRTAKITNVTFLNCHKLQKLKIIPILGQNVPFSRFWIEVLR